MLVAHRSSLRDNYFIYIQRTLKQLGVLFLRSSLLAAPALHRRIVVCLRLDTLFTLGLSHSLLWAVSLVKNDTQSFSTSLPSSQRDNFDLWSKQKCPTSVGHFLLSLGEQLNLPLRASEVIFDSEVHFVSEVSPIGEVVNLTSLVRSTNFTA